MQQRSALVFWPTEAKTITLLPSSEFSSQQQQQQQQSFLLGWNVRDFTVVVAAIVSSSSLTPVYDAIKSMYADVQRLCFSEHERASAPTLTIVGVLYSSNNNEIDPTIIKALRSSTTAFVELENTNSSDNNIDNNLPRLRSLYTSSIKFDATLHLMCYQDSLFDIRKAPLPFSPLVRLGVGDVESILAGKNASRVLKGAQSVLEGPFLPPHALNLMPPLHRRHFAPRSLNTGSFAATAMPVSNLSIGGGSGSNNNSMVAAQAASLVLAASTQQPQNNSNLESHLVDDHVDDDDDDDQVEVDIKTLDPTIPPRLRFPTATSLTDLSCCKSCLSGACFVQHKLEIFNTKKNKQQTSGNNNNNNSLLNCGCDQEDDDDEDNFNNDNNGMGKNPTLSSPTKTVPSKNNGKSDNSILVGIAASATPIVAFVLQIAVALAKFSYTGAIVEYKMRELSNVLALIQKKTTTCGLHPVLPHTLCGIKGERRTCLLAFAARQVVGDILFGFILTWVLAFESGRIFDFMRQFAWYGLHGMHVGYFDWFHGYPAGFKMNADLNEVLYMITNNTMYFFSTIVDIISYNIDIYAVSYFLLGATCFCGASLAFSFVADCCNLATLHIRFLYHVIAFFYQSLTTVTGSLLLLIRGKKRNPLKNRVDEASFEFDEVVLGTMSCCAAAFLIPTVALYYLYLACARTVIWVIQESFRGIAVLCCNAPIFPGFLWLTRRKQWLLTGGVVLANVRARTHDLNNDGSGTATKKKDGGGSDSNQQKLDQQRGGNPNNNNNNNSNGVASDDHHHHHHLESSHDVVADVVFLSLPFMTIFRELFLLIQLLFFGTFSVSRILRFIWFADANSKPVVDVPNKIFKHLTADPAHPILVRGNTNNTVKK